MRPRFDCWVGKICWRRDKLPMPVFLGFPRDSAGKNLPAMQGTWVWSLGWDDPLEKGMAIHSSILAWRIPWAIMGLQRVGQDWATFTFSFHHNFFICSSVNRHLDCFHVMAIVSSAAKNIGILESFWIMVVSGYVPSSGIAGSYGSFISSF